MRRVYRRLTCIAWMTMAFGVYAQTPPPAEGQPKLPLGIRQALWDLSVPKDRLPTPAQVALGEKLFNDKRLSLDDSTSCATCHDPNLGFADGKPRAVGIGSQEGMRNSPTILNAVFLETQFWDGRAGTLEDQAKLPILNPIEMGMPNPETVVAKLIKIPEYATEFQKVFNRPLNYDDLARAIAAFERTQIFGNSRFDRFLAGNSKALNASEKRGWALFNGKARCNSCHAGNAINPLFTDHKFHNIGVAAKKQDFVTLAGEAVRVVRTGDEKQIDELALQTKFSELGRFLVTKKENDIGSFKTSALRNIAVTGPYMHDGSFATLWDVMDHYNKGGEANPFLDGGMQRLGLTEPEIDDLVALMFALTSDELRAQERTALTQQRRQKAKRPNRDTAAATGKKGSLGDVAPNPDLAVKNPAEIGHYGQVGGN